MERAKDSNTIAREALNDARATSECEIRAYLVFTGTKWIWAPGKAKALRAEVTLENVGNTPAFAVHSEHQVGLIVLSDPTIDVTKEHLSQLPPVLPMPNPSLLVLTKGDPHRNVATSVPVPSDALEMIKAKKAVAFVRGWVEYNDVFGVVRRRTNYCYYFDEQTIRNGFEFLAAPTGSNMT